MIRLIYTFFIFSPITWSEELGSLLFNGNCATCHHIDKASSAPSIIEVRDRYKQAFKNKKDFVNYMTTWVVKPKKETSLMHDKIEKYGLMPELAFEKDTVEKITSYIYDGDIKATTK